MSASGGSMKMNASASTRKSNNIQVYLRLRPTNERERTIRSLECVEVPSAREVVVKMSPESKSTKKFTFDRAFGPESKQSEIYHSVVSPLIEEVLSGYNCTVFAYGQTGTGKTHTMVGAQIPTHISSWEDNSELGIIPRSLGHLFRELRVMGVEFSMRVSYLELYNEELFDLLSTSETAQIRIFDDANKKGSIIVQGLEEITVKCASDVYDLLAKGTEKRKTAATLMNNQSSRSHTIFSILVHIRENGLEGEELLKIGKLNLVDLAGSENLSKAGNEKGIRTRETVNINQSLLTLGRVITALVERTPHIPYRESKLTRLLQESLGGRTKTSIIATVSPGHKDIDETLSTLEYAHRAKNIQNKPEINQRLNKKAVLKEFTEEIDRLKRDLTATREKNGIYVDPVNYAENISQIESQKLELIEKEKLIRDLSDASLNIKRLFDEVSLNLSDKTTELISTQAVLKVTAEDLGTTKKVLRTTKRGYLEKKHLLESHIRTEEQLIGQATELIEVVESASTDTHLLHETIERRRSVDAAIQSAADRHTEAMDKDLLRFNTDVEQMVQNYTSHNQVQMEEFEKNSKLTNENCSNTTDMLQSIIASKKSANFAILQRLGDKFNAMKKQQLDNIANRRTASKEHFESLIEFCETGYNDLIALTLNLTNQQDTYTEHHKELIEMTKSNENTTSKFCEIYCEDTERFLPNIKQFIERTENCNLFCIAEIEANKKRREQMQTMMLQIQHLYEESQQSDQRNVTYIERSSETLKELLVTMEENTSQTIDQHQRFAVESGQRHEKQTNALDMWNKNANQFTSENLAFVTEMVSKNATQKRLLNDEDAKTKEMLDVQQNDTIERIRLSQAEIADFVTEAESKEAVESELLLASIKSTNDQHNESNNVCVSLTNAMARDITDYGVRVNQHVTECRKRVQNFHSKDIQVYRSTGETPSKRDFKYPKQLAHTSPHERIAQRFWNNFNGTIADLECSLAISEGEESAFLEGITDEKSSSVIQRSRSNSPNQISKSTLVDSTNPNLLTVEPNQRSSSAPTSPLKANQSKLTSDRRKQCNGNKENFL